MSWHYKKFQRKLIESSVGQVKSKQIFSETIIQKIFKAKSSFHVK